MLPHVLIAEPGAFAEIAARAIESRLRTALERRERAHLALAGGSTPRPVYRELALRSGLGAEQWARVEFFWSDERMVGAAGAGSNVTAAARELLAPLGILERRIHRPAVEGPAGESALRYDRVIRAAVPDDASGWPRFDLVLLGVGEDGHTASLFPTSDPEASNGVVATESPIPPRERISFSYELLAAAREVLFLVSGPGKASIVRRLLGSTGSRSELPAARVHRTARRAAWILDRGAASKLASPAP